MTLKYTFQPQQNGTVEVVTTTLRNKSYPKLSVNNTNNKQIQAVLKEIEDLVGLESVKKLLFEIQTYIEIQK